MFRFVARTLSMATGSHFASCASLRALSIIVSVAFVATGFSSAAVVGQDSIDIHLRERAEIAGIMVRLTDVAIITGEPRLLTESLAPVSYTHLTLPTNREV